MTRATRPNHIDELIVKRLLNPFDHSFDVLPTLVNERADEKRFCLDAIAEVGAEGRFQIPAQAIHDIRLNCSE